VRYNNYNTGFSSADGRASRSPYWRSAGHETPDGRILFSQPEIVLYGVVDSDQRPGYPDFIEDVDGSIWISETQKSASRVHRLPSGFLLMLWGQKETKARVMDGLAVNVTDPTPSASCPLPDDTFPDLRVNGSGRATPENVTWPGFALDFRLTVYETKISGHLLQGTAASSEGELCVSLSNAGNVTLVMADADGHAFSIAIGPGCAAALGADRDKPHYVAFVIDGGAAIGSAMVDGKLCDGSMYHRFEKGWDLSFGGSLM